MSIYNDNGLHLLERLAFFGAEIVRHGHQDPGNVDYDFQPSANLDHLILTGLQVFPFWTERIDSGKHSPRLTLDSPTFRNLSDGRSCADTRLEQRMEWRFSLATKRTMGFVTHPNATTKIGGLTWVERLTTALCGPMTPTDTIKLKRWGPASGPTLELIDSWTDKALLEFVLKFSVDLQITYSSDL